MGELWAEEFYTDTILLQGEISGKIIIIATVEKALAPDQVSALWVT